MGLETHEAGLMEGRHFKHERIDPNRGDKPEFGKIDAKRLTSASER